MKRRMKIDNKKLDYKALININEYLNVQCWAGDAGIPAPLPLPPLYGWLSTSSSLSFIGMPSYDYHRIFEFQEAIRLRMLEVMDYVKDLNLCGHCLAYRLELRSCNGTECPTVGFACLRCYFYGHGHSECKVKKPVKIPSTYGMCYLCYRTSELHGDVDFKECNFTPVIKDWFNLLYQKGYANDNDKIPLNMYYRFLCAFYRAVHV